MDSRVADHHWISRGVEAEDQDRPSRAQAEDAVRTLIRWAGDDPAREGRTRLERSNASTAAAIDPTICFEPQAYFGRPTFWMRSGAPVMSTRTWYGQ
jgi:hypothetical protein